MHVWTSRRYSVVYPQAVRILCVLSLTRSSCRGGDSIPKIKGPEPCSPGPDPRTKSAVVREIKSWYRARISRLRHPGIAGTPWPCSSIVYVSPEQPLGPEIRVNQLVYLAAGIFRRASARCGGRELTRSQPRRRIGQEPTIGSRMLAARRSHIETRKPYLLRPSQRR